MGYFVIIICVLLLVVICYSLSLEKKEYKEWLKKREECIKEGARNTEENKQEMMVLKINWDKWYGRKDGQGKFFHIISWNRIQISDKEYRNVDLNWVDVLETKASDENYKLFLKQYSLTPLC